MKIIYEIQISVSIISFIETAMLIHVYIVCGYFCTGIAELFYAWPAKPKVFTIWTFTKKISQPLV